MHINISDRGVSSEGERHILNKRNMVVTIGRNRMGAGSDELGQILLKSYVSTLKNLENTPSQILLFNAGVQLAIEGTNTVEDLKALEDAGCNIQICGTCLNYFELTEKVAVGRVSNMQNISEAMAAADHLVNL